MFEQLFDHPDGVGIIRQAVDAPFDESGPLLPEDFVVGVPRRPGATVSVDAESTPVLHDLLDLGGCCVRLQAEGVAAEVDRRRAVLEHGKREAMPLGRTGSVESR